MFPVSKMHNSFEKNTLFLAILSLCLILPFFFINEKSGRVLFYLCSYLSIAGIILQYKDLKSAIPHIKKTLPFLSISALLFLWSCYAKIHSTPGVDNGLLFTPAKRWFLSSLIIIYMLWSIEKHFTGKRLLMSITIFSLYSAFAVASFYGIWQHLNGIDRVTLGIDRATMSAYAYSALALAILALTSRSAIPFNKYPLIISIWLLSIYVISLTETRSAMLFHTLFSLSIIINFSLKKNRAKTLLTTIVLVLIVTVLFANKNPMKSRLNLTKEEITEYAQGNDHTSLGSRFTLWKMGILTFTQEPFGQTQVHRNDIIKNFLNKNNPNSFALEYIDVHLHNEFIQYSSIFGIFGIVILLYFYTTIIFNKSHSNILNNPISMLAISALSYGLSDVLLTSDEYIVLFSALYLSLNIINKSTEDSD